MWREEKSLLVGKEQSGNCDTAVPKICQRNKLASARKQEGAKHRRTSL